MEKLAGSRSAGKGWAMGVGEAVPSPGWTLGLTPARTWCSFPHFQVNEGELGGNVIFADSWLLVKVFSEKTPS